MKGIRIVDVSRVLAGPWATMHLADQGAEVIKVESPRGDETRGFGPYAGETSTYYLCANRNKRSIALDLKSAEDRAVLHQLVATADVFVQNFRPGVADRLGCDYATLKAIKPDLVYVAIHAFGAEGEYAHRPGYDLVLQAAGGAMAITGHPGSAPTKTGTSIADITTGLFANQAILLGLLHRERTGEGQSIVVSMLQSQAHALAYHSTRYYALGEEDVQRGNSHRGLSPYDVYRCADGWLALGCGNDAMFKRMCAAFEVEVQPGWETNASRLEARSAVDAAVSAALARFTVAEADALASRAGVPAGPVLTPGQTLEHPALETIEVDHPELGRLRMVAPALQTRTTRRAHSPPPGLDAHRAELLTELGSMNGDSGS